MTVEARRRAWLAAAIAAIPLVAYSLVSLAQGLPRFPGEGDCDLAPVEGRPVNVVFGRFESPVAAEELREQVTGYGFVGTRVEPDGCGRFMVVLANVPSAEIGRGVVDEARSVDLDPSVELDQDG